MTRAPTANKIRPAPLSRESSMTSLVLSLYAMGLIKLPGT